MRRLPILLPAAAALALPALGVGGSAGMVGGSYGGGIQMTTIGTGKKTCVLKPGADCRGVVHRWAAEHHGNLSKAKFTKADLRGADFRGADLRGADFRGAKLRHAELRGARLKGARFDAPPKTGKRANGFQLPECQSYCAGADLSGTDFSGTNLNFAVLVGTNLTGANLTNADLTLAILVQANLTRANLTSATLESVDLTAVNVTGANLTRANLTGAYLDGPDWRLPAGANLTGAIFSNTTCPNGTVTSTGC